MTAKVLKSERTTSLKVKTGVKAGRHCWDAFNDFVNDRNSHHKRDVFLDCCLRDPQCLHQ